MDHFLYVSAGHVVCLQLIAGNVAQSGFVGFNHGRYNGVRRYITDTHQKELYQRDVYA